ncbi:MAG: hypothetical protein RL077_4439, partial [Verrucomicrobiota bacterium]
MKIHFPIGKLKLLLALLGGAMNGLAEEGMWMPQQMPALAGRLAELGYRGEAKTFADLTGFPMGAIVSLGGCSASFVSPAGLIVTNHHCVQGALQFNSQPDRNLMQDGFLARTREAELPSGPGSRVYVTIAVEEVTTAVRGGIAPEVKGRALHDLIEQRTKALTAEREKKAGVRCTVASFFEGLNYFAITQIEIRDVRLVYAPAAGIGNFGGETDNWQWPRHTGDFSFLRAYVSKDGQPADFSKDNVPFAPKHWLKVSAQGASPDELVIVAGYPGRTARLATYEAVKETVQFSLPRTIKRNTEQIAILEKLAADDTETALRVSTRIRGLNNTLTKTKGVHEAMVKGGVLAQKENQERAFVAWIAGDPARQAKYGKVIPEIATLAAERRQTRERHQLLMELTGGIGSALGSAEMLYRLAVERAKPDADRDPSYQQRNWPRLREGQDRLQRSLDRKADRALMAYHLAHAAGLPTGERIEEIDRLTGLAPGMSQAVAGRTLQAFVDELVAGSKLYDRAFRLGLFEMTTAELAATGDPMLALAAKLYPIQEAIRNRAKEQAGTLTLLGPVYAEALLAKEGNLVAPDANSTLRVTFGTVKGVENRDGNMYLPHTT